MEINDSFKKTGPVGASSTTAKASASKGAEKAEPAKTNSQSDNVKISAQAQAIGGSSTFDVKKVNEIKAAIASGTFQVNPEKVANGLIDTVKDLLSSRKG
ncbi:flagellar biosynthesis anti-sigma factor FlgM [Actimicrobium sp. CCI2.3]|uniref:flagellar biosynthesis anti-sigma factor FlgM n=1 Tax=Actimicrobium sp. CCI2.3 TaxID=3048616 RepID=UPI002AB45104|nr:flagellar biosynthesis anti-sigma factor FlgM [Actimicrobium sp. CCI2.3]MDY7575026.1 flagellar biosynthesis anti-sigma factor FlgM [Actimicrobium sp. CCI2.3]MEB0021403.1 flagellar biosynthesis anti-sigma factor FlgM [Actimicrobium sp. CCI2.3]